MRKIILEFIIPCFGTVKQPLFLGLLTGIFAACSNRVQEDYKVLIEKGEYSQAKTVIGALLRVESALPPARELELQFEIERMERIQKDFTRTEDEVMAYIRTVIPGATAADRRRWEESRALEYIMIDGEKRYFARAGRNFFRIDSTARSRWEEKHKDEPITPGSGAKLELDGHNQSIIEAAERTDQEYNWPLRFRIRQGVEVHQNAVPAGETICCWIPFPRDIPGRQGNIQLISTDPVQHIVADNATNLQRTVYFEKPSQADRKTRFEVVYEYTSHGVYVAVNSAKVQPVEITPELAPYVRQEPPHIVFSPALKKLSRDIVGDEENPYLIARMLFEWVDDNIPWASAREYSTIRNISRYGYENRHGDCGIQTLLFITLCRMNGIPARWQSGWEFQPPDDSMHDWGMVYFAPYGWVPVDVTYGLRKSDDPKLKWFYLSGMDSYRLIFNDAYSQPIYPAKVHPRSETVDSQRGEVEWRGGNLYFEQWDWIFEWEVLD